jgi:predicted amidohydrolase
LRWQGHTRQLLHVARFEMASLAAAAVARRTALAAVAQMTSVADHSTNLRVVAGLAAEAKARGAVMLFLPENFAFFGDEKVSGVDVAEPLNGPVIQRYCDLARTHSMWLSGAGFQEVVPEAAVRCAVPAGTAVIAAAGDGPQPQGQAAGADGAGPSSRAGTTTAQPAAAARRMIHNTHVVIDASGKLIAAYRKVHLFDVNVPGAVLKESAYVVPGDELMVVDTPLGRLGLSTCYDVRFPQVYSALDKGAWPAGDPTAGRGASSNY